MKPFYSPIDNVSVGTGTRKILVTMTLFCIVLLSIVLVAVYSPYTYEMDAGYVVDMNTSFSKCNVLESDSMSSVLLVRRDVDSDMVIERIVNNRMRRGESLLVELEYSIGKVSIQNTTHSIVEIFDLDRDSLDSYCNIDAYALRLVPSIPSVEMRPGLSFTVVYDSNVGGLIRDML